ncbi:4Fe-4S dicluster domain-containing protein [Desulforudis sp. 1088]|jgi:heterodisulfide reductase subunit C|uniref:4Fe-4S dicluster domain-containing protein n=1 Tax=unclassified Candidatus Desulforudis TaxID=2635950 RepID=UPI003481AAAB
MVVVSNRLPLERDHRFLDEVRQRSGQALERCFQCQKCASGCLLADYADYAPNQILRMVQFGLRDKVLGSSAIWLCSSCQACGARCPNGIDLSAVMDCLKEMAVAAGIGNDEHAALFHRLFLNEIAHRGRVNEALVLAKYKLRTRELLADLPLGFSLFRKGKMSLFSSRVKDREALNRIFERTAQCKPA